MISSINNITFFFPYPYISGVPVLFSNVTNYLLANSSMTINIIDYEGGALIKNCNKNKKLNFIKFEDFKDCLLDFDTYLVIQAGLPYKIRNELKIGNKVKILQWGAHEYNLIPFVSQINFIRKLQEKHSFFYKIIFLINYKKMKALKKWLTKMIDRGAISFMTKQIYLNSKKYIGLSDDIKEHYLPNLASGITEYSKKTINQNSQKVKTKLDIAWIGRIGDFKIHILNYTIEKLSIQALNNKTFINFHVIGEGEFSNELNLNLENKYFKITNKGKLDKREVDIYLLENIHVVFSMGTAALDGARIGLPVVLLDQSYIKVKDGYIFRYLFDTKGLDLGHPMIDSDFKIGNNSIDIILKDITDNYITLSNKTLKYFNNNHSVEIVTKKLISLLENQSYYYNEIDKELLKLGLFRKLYLYYLKKVKKSYY